MYALTSASNSAAVFSKVNLGGTDFVFTVAFLGAFAFGADGLCEEALFGVAAAGFAMGAGEGSRGGDFLGDGVDAAQP